MNIDVIERKEKVIVVDEEGESHKIPISDGYLEKIDSIDEEIYIKAVSHTDYEAQNNIEIDWPIRTQTSHHLEGTLFRSIIDSLSSKIGKKEANRYFEKHMGGRPKPPAIEVYLNWEVSENGELELDYIKYNGEKYTK